MLRPGDYGGIYCVAGWRVVVATVGITGRWADTVGYGVGL